MIFLSIYLILPAALVMSYELVMILDRTILVHKGRLHKEFGSNENKRLLMASLRMPSSGMLRRVALVRTDVSEERIASFIRVTRIGEQGTLAVTSNRRTRSKIKLNKTKQN
jgi:hypothetical protein